ncbi:MAG: DUF364 domain-containing protein [Dehalococcoidia bacterium]|nr:DUF364 domain-containing protein [Dehalococcoidia bacterium]
MSIVKELIDLLEKKLHRVQLTIEDVRIGVFYTAVSLSDGHAGVAFTPRDMEDTVCCPRSAAKMPASGKLKGAAAWDIARYALSDNSLKRSVGIAVLNALSARLFEEETVSGFKIYPGKDALEAIDIGRNDRVVLVGAFTPFIRKLKQEVDQLCIIDKHPQALKKDEMSMWRAPATAPEVLAQADIAIITGSSLVEGGLEDLLSYCKNAREIVLAGPTASVWPAPLFNRGVTVMGGITVDDAGNLLQVVSEGGSGYFFNGPARKVAVIKNRLPS